MEIVRSSFANVIVSLSLLSCVLLLLSLSIRSFLSSKGWGTRKLMVIEISLRFLPFLLFSILFFRYFYSHLSLNFLHVHVAYHLDSDSTIIERIQSLFSGYDGASMMLMSIILLVNLLLYFDKKIIKVKNKDIVDRWFSLLWIICLTGILPEQTFFLIENGTPLSVDKLILFSSFRDGLLASLGYGILLGFSPYAMELEPENKYSRNLLRFLAIGGIFLIFFGPLDALIPLASSEWNSELFSDPQINRLGTIFITLSLFSFMPLFLFYTENLDSTIPAGMNRSLGLLLVILTGLLSLISSSIILLYPNWSVVSIFYELIIELFPILILSLAFCLLPTLGFDERARPELHGWRFGLFTGSVIGTINSSIISLAMMNGIILSLFLSLTIPILVEKSQLISKKIKLYNLFTSLVFMLLIIILVLISSDLRIIIMSISVVFILSIELNNSILPKRKIT